MTLRRETNSKFEPFLNDKQVIYKPDFGDNLKIQKWQKNLKIDEEGEDSKWRPSGSNDRIHYLANSGGRFSRLNANWREMALLVQVFSLVGSILVLFGAKVSAFDLDSCNDALGMESGEIKAEQISASSSYQEVTGPANARLNVDLLGGAWCPKGMVGKEGKSDYLQINLRRLHVISHVATQGRFGNGHGVEYAESYLLEYWRQGLKEWKAYKMYNGSKILKGNSNSYTAVKRVLMPPIIGSKIRFIPFSEHPRTVCMRVEVIGCIYKDGLLSYSMPQGITRSLDVQLIDASYDGNRSLDGRLSGGLGQLSDGVTGHYTGDFRTNLSRGRGYEWVGWKDDSSGPLEIIFHFSSLRNFTSVVINANNMFSKEVQVFSKAVVRFSFDGQNFLTQPLEFNSMIDNVSEYSRNVSISLRGRVAKYLKIQLYFSSKWIMISEIFFISFPIRLSSNSSTKGVSGNSQEIIIRGQNSLDEEIDDVYQDSKGYMLDGTQVTDNERNLVVTGLPDDAQHQRHVALVIGVLIAVILLLMGAILFIFWKTRRQKTGLNHDLLPGPFGEKRDIISLRNGIETEELSKNCLYSEPFHLTYGSSYSTNTNMVHGSNAQQASSPDYTECASTDYAIPHLLQSGSESSPYRNASSLAQPKTSSQSHLSSFLSKGTPTPPSSSPHVTLKVDGTPAKGGCAPYGTTSRNKHVKEGLYATAEIIQNKNNEERKKSVQSDIVSSFLEGESISNIIGPTYPPEVPREHISLFQKIGEGQFGEVHIGHIKDEDGRSQLVAVKTLKLEASAAVRSNFEREVEILSGLRDENIVGVVAVCAQEEPLCMMVEYCQHGDLNQYLQARLIETASSRATNAKTISYGALIYMATQVASGMKYLESLNFVHRDLDTRNCLVDAGYVIKISDFGMSRQMYRSDYYSVEEKVLIPIRWMAWESLLLGKFSTKSDVWAFAVTLWEILTLAREKPFEDLSDEQIIENLSLLYHSDVRNMTLAQPQNCPKEIYDLMRECWKRSDVDRPSFKEIHMFLQRKNLGYAPWQIH